MDFRKIISLIIVVTLCLTLFGCGEDKTTTINTTESNALNVEKTITLVAGNADKGFWRGMKKGAEDAAVKYGYRLGFSGVDEGTFNVVTSHISSLGKAIDSGVDGVVIAPDGEGYSEIYGRLYDEKIPVVQVGYLTENDFEMLESNKKNPILSTVTTDYRQAGAVAAERLFEKIKEEIKKSNKPFVVGVIEREDSISDEEISGGFVEKFTELADADPQLKDKYRVETESESRYEDSFNELVVQGAKAVFFLHHTIADKISDVVMAEKEEYKDIIFCGFDSGAKQLKWLTDGNGEQFIGGVAQEAYYLGYNAVEQCIFAVDGKAVKEEIKITGVWYDKENIDKMKQDNLVYEK